MQRCRENGNQGADTVEFLIGLIILVLDIYAIVKIIGSGASGLTKILWILGIVILPVVGFLVWLIAGPKGATV